MLDLVYGQASEIGRVWPRNADAAAAFVPRSREEARLKGWMFAVADGRGATDFGHIASKRAVERMVDGFAESSNGISLANLMPRLVQHANAGVHDEALSPERAAMVACALRDDAAVISHAGDSRCYQVRSQQVTLLTQDYTRLAEQKKVTGSPGPELSLLADTSSFPVAAGDILVLCTDGLCEAMYPEDIMRIVSQKKEPAELARELVAYAVQVDGSDNATAQVVLVRGTEARDR